MMVVTCYDDDDDGERMINKNNCNKLRYIRVIFGRKRGGIVELRRKAVHN